MEEEEVSLPLPSPNIDEDCSFSPPGDGDDEAEIPFPPPADDDVENGDSLGENELKYVPVKTELGPFENENANNVEDDHFLRFARNSSHQNFYNENEEMDDIFRGQEGRDNSEMSSDDDPDDDNWTSNSNKKKKNTKRARKRRKVTKGRRRVRGATLEKNAKITPEEREALRVQREEQRKKRQEEKVKREVEGVDEDLPGVSSDSTKVQKRRGRKKKVVDVTLEESEAKKPRKPRQKKKRTKVVSECDENEDDSSNDTTTKRRSSSASRRRRTENMTPEEHEAMKAKWREEARLKRQRLRDKMTPEEREEFLAKQREQTRRRRQERSDQEKEEKRRIAAEQKRARRALLPAEKRKEEAQKVALRRIIRKSEMSEEEKRLYRMKNYMAYMARLASLPPEEIERRKQQKLEYARMRNAAMTPEMREKKKESQRKYRMNMTEDKRERFLEGLRACYRNRIEKLKQDPVKWEEVKKKWKENNNRKKEYMKQEGIPSSRSAALAFGPGRRRINPNETPEERAQRLREKKRQSQRRRKLQKKLTIQNLMDSGLSMEEIQRQMETPEQRERRLMNARINKAKNNLRKRLVQTGAPPEEVQHRLEELIATYQPRPTFRPYKPRADNFKRLEPIDIEFLLTAETKAEPASEPSIASPTYSTVTVTSPAPPPQLFQQPVQLRQLQSVILQPALQQSAQYVYSFQPETPSPQTLQPQQLQQTPSLQYQSTQSSISGTQSSSYPFQNLFDAINITSYQPQQDPVPGYDYSSYTKETIQSSPPTSPPGTFGHHDDYSGYNSDGQQSATPVKKPHITTLTKREYKSRPGPKNGPRGPKNTKKPVVRDQICDLCGNAYGSNYIREHKNEHHNPNWVNGKCIVCHMEFTVGRQFWKHYRREHLNITNSKRRCGPRGPRETTKRNANSRLNRDVVCEECGNAYSSHYITEHKNQHHHPNFVDRKCTICNEEFSAGRLFWRHFRSAHMGPEPERNYICEKCGAAFRQPQYLKKHEYFAHGDGLKEENYKECPVCHKKFKQGIALTAHIKRMHDKIPNLTSKYECMRCEEKFDDAKTLTDHVKVTHPKAYFPCEHCNILKYSEAGLKFHYMRCNKKPEGFLKEYREKMNGYSIERTPVECEFCGSKIAIFSLTRHYNEVHGVVEDKFECSKCGKNFKRRDFWVVHMEMIHGVPLEDMLDEARKLNVKDRDKIEVKFPKGKRRLKGAERKKALGVKSDIEEGSASTQKRRRISKTTGKRRGRPKKKQVELVEDSENSEDEDVADEDENEERWTSSGSEDDEDKRPRRVTSLSRGERLSRRLAKRDNNSFNDSSNQEVGMNVGRSRDEDNEDNNAVAANLQIDKQLVIPITPMMTDAEIDALVKREILSEGESDA